MQFERGPENRAFANNAASLVIVPQRRFQDGMRGAVRPLLTPNLRAGVLNEIVEFPRFVGILLCALPGSNLRLADFHQLVLTRFAHEDFDFALRGLEACLCGTFLRELLNVVGSFRESLAQMFDAPNGKPFRVHLILKPKLVKSIVT